MNFQKEKRKNRHLLTGSPSSLSEANPVAIFQLCSVLVGQNPKSQLAAPHHRLRRSARARKGPQASMKRSEPDLLAVLFALTWPPLGRAKNVMFCSSYVLLRLPDLENNDGAGGTLGGSNLGGLFCFFFFLLPFPVSPSLSLSSGNRHVVSHRFSRGKRLRLLQRRRNRSSLQAPARCFQTWRRA